MRTLCEKEETALLRAAKDARRGAYAPYSGFCVGAALLSADGRVFTGCNVENASYGMTNCAERTAFFKAISEGARAFVAIAVCGGKEGEETVLCPPCGACRQVMAEFCDGDFLILLEDADRRMRIPLSDLLPLQFQKPNKA